jgi:protease secretion system membrane fusion protein
MNKWLKIGQGKLTPLKNTGDITDVQDLRGLSDYGDTEKPIKLGFWVLIVGFGGFLLWAFLAPLDEGVSAQGQVSIESRHKTIQHMNGGIVREVFVNPRPDVAKSGQSDSNVTFHREPNTIAAEGIACKARSSKTPQFPPHSSQAAVEP